MAFLRILHISDLHVRADWKEDEQEIVEAMLRDAEAFAAERRFDFAVFSGDLAFSGAAAEFALATEILLEPLENRLALPRDRIMIVPGNHDVARSAIDEIDEAGLRSVLVNREKLNALLGKQLEVERACTRMKPFENFYEGYFSKHLPEVVQPLGRVRRMTIDGVTIGVLGLNSAWRSAGDDDKNRLLLGDRQTSMGLKALDACDVRLVVVHHPLNWLTGFDADAVRTLLEQRGCIVLSGHEHASNPTFEMTPGGQVIYSRAGCLYETLTYQNSYSILDIDTGAGTLEMHLRTWWAPRRQFDAAVHVAANGRVTFSLPGSSGAPLASQAGLRRPAKLRATNVGSVDPTDLKGVIPAELQQAALQAYTPLYKSFQAYTFEVIEILPDRKSLRVNLTNSYAVVNPTSIRLEHRPALTPVRPLHVTKAVIADEQVDLTNPDFDTERGLVIPMTLPPHSETHVDLCGEVEYRLPDSEVFLTYLPALQYHVELRFIDIELRFIGEPLMPRHLTREASYDGPIAHVRYRAKGPVLAYWGMKLDWLPISNNN